MSFNPLQKPESPQRLQQKRGEKDMCESLIADTFFGLASTLLSTLAENKLPSKQSPLFYCYDVPFPLFLYSSSVFKKGIFSLSFYVKT